MLKKEAIERLTKYRMAVEQALEARRAWGAFWAEP